MILSEKFKNATEFVQYAEYVSGYDFDDAKLTKWYNENPKFLLTYTGIMQQIKPFITGKK